LTSRFVIYEPTVFAGAVFSGIDIDIVLKSKMEKIILKESAVEKRIGLNSEMSKLIYEESEL
jgi:hypothetical protein